MINFNTIKNDMEFVDKYKAAMLDSKIVNAFFRFKNNENGEKVIIFEFQYFCINVKKIVKIIFIMSK